MLRVPAKGLLRVPPRTGSRDPVRQGLVDELSEPPHVGGTASTPGVTAPAADVRLGPPQVDVPKIGHGVEDTVEGIPLRELADRRHRLHRPDEPTMRRRHVAAHVGQDSGCQGLDLHVYENEPVLVIEVNEVLQGVEIPQLNRTVRPKPPPVVEGIAVLAQHGRAPQEPAGVTERDRDVGREAPGRPVIA